MRRLKCKVVEKRGYISLTLRQSSISELRDIECRACCRQNACLPGAWLDRNSAPCPPRKTFHYYGAMPPSTVLTSWKEIATYLGKGVRTVQRWERDLGLPVRRPIGNSKHVVLAVPSELDAWMSSGFAQRELNDAAKAVFRYRILVVDDDARFRQMVKALLESKDFEVLAAEDGFEGLATLKRALPDLIISDLKMPNMNGFEFLSVVRHRFPQLPVIAVSGEYATSDLPASVLADAYFKKGHYAIGDFFNRIVQLLEAPPTRPRQDKGYKPPVWIPLPSVGKFVVVTCPNCLRTFPTMKTQEITVGIHNALCDYCAAEVCFEITEPHLQRVRTAKADRKLRETFDTP